MLLLLLAAGPICMLLLLLAAGAVCMLLLLAAGLTLALPTAHELTEGLEQQQHSESCQRQQDCGTGSTHTAAT
jgi:hypothetical protein